MPVTLSDMYSLVSASVLALDLARHPSGAAVADVVDRVLALVPEEVAALDEAGRAAPDLADVRAQVHEAAAAPRMTSVLGGVRDAVALAPEGRLPDPSTTRVLADVVASALLGGLPDLLALLEREEPLRAAPAAARRVALDAVAVAWAGRAEGVELGDLARLRAPWAAALGPVPVPLAEDALGPQGPAVRALLEEVPRRTLPQWDAVAAAQRTAEDPLAWSTRMHEASRVAWESGRLVPVARAQLALARAVRLSGVSASRAAQGAGLAAAAAVQATCLADLLPAALADGLLAPWRSAEG